MSLDVNTTTVQQAKDWLNENIMKGAKCPCCNQKAKVYKRFVTEKQAALLILLHRTFPVGTVLDINNFVSSLQPQELVVYILKGREWGKLKYWGLLEEVPVTKELRKKYGETYPHAVGKGKRVSFHRLTETGAAFVQGAPIYKFVYVYDDVVRGWDQNTTATIVEALSTKFDYTTLAQTQLPAVGHIIV
jgi:hypothetical protein